LPVGGSHRRKKRSNSRSSLDGVSQSFVLVNLVAITPALTNVRQDTIGFQLSDNPLHGALGDTYLLGNIAQPRGRVTSQTDQHMRVVREKRPTVRREQSDLGIRLV
jgi:hypothetical protein